MIRIQLLHRNHCRICLLDIKRHKFIALKGIRVWFIYKISNCDRSISRPVQQGCPSFRQWIESSCDASTGRFNAQHVKNFLITSVGNSAQASIVHCKTVLLGGSFKFPAAVSSCIPIVPSHSSYFSVQEALNGLFQLTSGAWMYLVQPPGTITRSTFFAFSDSLALCSIWHS